MSTSQEKKIPPTGINIFSSRDYRMFWLTNFIFFFLKIILKYTCASSKLNASLDSYLIGLTDRDVVFYVQSLRCNVSNLSHPVFYII